jgi:hypothetical protein
MTGLPKKMLVDYSDSPPRHPTGVTSRSPTKKPGKLPTNTAQARFRDLRPRGRVITVDRANFKKSTNKNPATHWKNPEKNENSAKKS